MAPSTSLRAITHRLTTTPVKDLPQVAAFLATSLSDCSDILSASQGQRNESPDSGNALLVTKLKARLTSLLQDRSFEGRWTAVVLVKAAIEAGQWEILRECEVWVRGLLSILSVWNILVLLEEGSFTDRIFQKTDPLSTKKLSIITLTRIFHLTHQYPTLIREITTPTLPSFITASLNLISIKPSSEPYRTLKEDTPLLETVLHSFNELISRHPTIFRPFSGQIRSLLVPIVGSSTISGSLSRSAIDLSQKLFISLHNCAPKNTGSEEWANTCRSTILSIHQAADHTFRSIIEQWESADPNLRKFTIPRDSSQVVGDQRRDALGLSEWQGIHAGAERLTTLLCLLSGFMSTRTASTISIPIGSVLDVTSRLLSVTAPKDGENGVVQANAEISRDEREALWIELPRIHSACINLLSNITSTLETAVIPIAQNIIEQTLWVFDAESSHSELRVSSYRLLEQLLPLVGQSTTKANVTALAAVIRQCCHDVLPPDTDRQLQQNDTKGKDKGSQGSTNVDDFLNLGRKGGSQSSSTVFNELQLVSSRLLPVFFHHIPPRFIPLPVRTELDRTAILSANHDAMMASVMNPVPPIKGRRPIPSILPFLAREHSKQQDIECLLRPRMPVLLGVSGGTLEHEEEDDDDEEEASKRFTAVQSQFISKNRVFETSLASTASSQGPSPIDVEEQIVQPQTKRMLPEDVEMADHRSRSLPSRAGDQNSPETKRARLESSDPPLEIAQSIPVTLTEAAATPAIVPSTSAPSVPSASDSGMPVSTSVATRVQSPGVQQMSGAIAGDDDSDDEIPVLNIEPDTDDDDDDDDDE
jgi:hypothetical protein